MNDGQAARDVYRVLTSAGPSAIAVVALRGPGVHAFSARHLHPPFPLDTDVRRATLLDAAGNPLDDIVVVRTDPAVLLLHLHGNPALVACCVRVLDDAGFVELPDLLPFDRVDDECGHEVLTLAPRILTARGLAWLAGQPAAHRALSAAIASVAGTPAARTLAEAALERGRVLDWFTRPLAVALVGAPNAGKSTLINALVDHPVSITSSIPGTTRDYVEALDEVDGFPVVWIDTAGVRDSDDALERAGAARSCASARAADVILVVVDHSASDCAAQVERVESALGKEADGVVLAKCDLAASPGTSSDEHLSRGGRPAVRASAVRRVGLEDVRRLVLDAGGRAEGLLSGGAAFTQRQRELLSRVSRCL